MGNEAGGIKEIYYSNGGSLDLDKNRVSADGGLRQKYAGEMGLPENLLSDLALEGESAATASSTGADPMTSAHVRNWMECLRSRKAPNADIEAGYQHSLALCMTIAALQTGKRVTFDDTKQEVVAG
jgi:hypothetical protein